MATSAEEPSSAEEAASSGRSPWGAVLVRLVVALVLVTAVAGVLALLDVSAFPRAWGLCAIVVGALVGLTANDQVTRGVSIDLGTVFGGGLPIGPDRHRERGPSPLTGLGAFLLVGLPVAVLGAVVLSL